MKMAVVNASDYAKACTVWYAHHHDDPGSAFMDYLGIHHYHAHVDGFVMSQHAARKLRMLLSPHATTIIKIYYARQSLCEN